MIGQWLSVSCHRKQHESLSFYQGNLWHLHLRHIQGEFKCAFVTLLSCSHKRCVVMYCFCIGIGFTLQQCPHNCSFSLAKLPVSRGSTDLGRPFRYWRPLPAAMRSWHLRTADNCPSASTVAGEGGRSASAAPGGWGKTRSGQYVCTLALSGLKTQP